MSNTQNFAKLAKFVALEHTARSCTSLLDLARIMATDTKTVLPYAHAVVWQAPPRLNVLAISGVANVDRTQETTVWFMHCIKILSSDRSKEIRTYDFQSLAPALRDTFPLKPSKLVTIVPMLDEFEEEVLGGALILHDEHYIDQAKEIFNLLMSHYQFIWLTKAPVQPLVWRMKRYFMAKKHRLYLLMVALIVLNFPVKMHVVGEVEVVPVAPIVLAAPINGIVNQILVPANSEVKAGTSLIQLKETDIVNHYKLAIKNEEVAAQRYKQVQQLSFNDKSERAKLAAVKADLVSKQAELAYAKSVHEQLNITAPASGVFIIHDRNQWVGKPVTVGEKIAQIAKTSQVRLKIQVPTSEMMMQLQGSNVKAYLNYQPLTAVKAKVTEVSYEAKMTKQQTLSYTVYAKLDNQDDPPHLGSVGTAKLYGGWALLWYDLLKRPISIVRQWLYI